MTDARAITKKVSKRLGPKPYILHKGAVADMLETELRTCSYDFNHVTIISLSLGHNNMAVAFLPIVKMILLSRREYCRR